MTTTEPTIGLSEQQLREKFEQELVLAMRVGGNAPTVQAIAHSVARVLELDHLEMAKQLRDAGVRLDDVVPRPDEPDARVAPERSEG